MGFLEVVIPPDFVPEETSGDTMVPEGGTARVSCKARGIPPPRVTWKREDGQDIVVRDHSGAKTKGNYFLTINISKMFPNLPIMIKICNLITTVLLLYRLLEIFTQNRKKC